MVYIPDEWFNDKQNKCEVFELFENNTDIIFGAQIMQTLTSLNEMVILEHFENGDIVLDL